MSEMSEMSENMNEKEDACKGLRNASPTAGSRLDDVIIDHRETCRNLWGLLSHMLRGCVYDHEVTGGCIMSEDVEAGGLGYHIEYRIDDSEEELVAEEAIDWADHVVRITISPVEDA